MSPKRTTAASSAMALAMALVLPACSDGEAPPASSDPGDRDAGRRQDAQPASDTPSEPGDTSKPPRGAGFVEPCTHNDDCSSNWCVDTGPDTKVCSRPCAGDEDCPDGWTCRTMVNAGGDAAQACVPDDAYDRDGDGYTPAGDPQDCDEGNPDVHPLALELCDGVDQDCDGETDEDFDVGGLCRVGVGVCEAEGTRVCLPNEQAAACSAEPGAPGQERCGNDLDDDCDGEVDEGYLQVGEACEIGVGACRADGEVVCADDGLGMRCTASPLPPGEEACNGRDDDCDGNIDNGDHCAEGEVCAGGSCRGADCTPCLEDLDCHEGSWCVRVLDGDAPRCLAGCEQDACEDGARCVAVGLREVCAPDADGDGYLVEGCGGTDCNDGEVEVNRRGVEVCNERDDDCDGEVDEDLGVPLECVVGVGACARGGLRQCLEDGRAVCGAEAGDAGEELCLNDVDDDCDGAVDEGFEALGSPCAVGVGACRREGVLECAEVVAACGAVAGAPVEEECDGIDNDCDSVVDEGDDGEPLGRECYAGPEGTEGVGPCRGGSAACVDGAWQEGCPGEVLPAPEVCGGGDEDCDGEVDEGCNACPAEDEVPEGWVCIPPTGPDGFLMGSPNDEPGRVDDREAQHLVEITRPFLLGATEVTQGGWHEVMDGNPSSFGDCGDTCPVENVSWLDAVVFCNALSRREGLEECYVVDGEDVTWPRGLDCAGYRLPTEAEWEYAARAGTQTAWSCGAVAPCLDEVAWYNANAGRTTHPVGTKVANAWGLYDMHGNVWEWVWDRYAADYGGHQGLDGVAPDPTGPLAGAYRVFRGGGWFSVATRLRAGLRHWSPPTGRVSYLGFRPARSVP